MSYPRVGAIYDDLSVLDSITRQKADLIAGGHKPTHVRMHPVTAREFDLRDELKVLADDSVKPGAARVLVAW
ncbi:hypothetical protein ANAEL_03442 [Anaerolineales bacterium]|nr:hypothetical protein ANAEL_03442 [Anaerolineales bacterium]